MLETNNYSGPNLVGKSHFFTETTGIVQLDADEFGISDAFGPIGSTDQEKSARFRLGAKFRLLSPTPKVKAFAICAGQIFIQPQTGSPDKVNLILRPLKQPISGLNIKYFIYRGLDKSDFLAEGDETLLAQSGTTELITNLWNTYDAFNGESTDPFLSAWIGYGLGDPPMSDLIDGYFFRIDIPQFDQEGNPLPSTKIDELPIVSAGTHLGHFSGEFQLDIVMGSCDYKKAISDTGFYFNMEFARAAEGILDIADCPSGYPVKAYREAILDFIDPAAFWGMHCGSGSVIFVFDNEIMTALIHNEERFSVVLNIFLSNRMIYIVIKDNFNRSYDYWNEYSDLVGVNNIRIGKLNDALSEQSYSSFLWPMKIIDSDDLNLQELNSLAFQLVGSKMDCTIFPLNGSFIFHSERSGLFEIKQANDNESLFTDVLCFLLNKIVILEEYIATSVLLCGLYNGVKLPVYSTQLDAKIDYSPTSLPLLSIGYEQLIVGGEDSEQVTPGNFLVHCKDGIFLLYRLTLRSWGVTNESGTVPSTLFLFETCLLEKIDVSDNSFSKQKELNSPTSSFGKDLNADFTNYTCENLKLQHSLQDVIISVRRLAYERVRLKFFFGFDDQDMLSFKSLISDNGLINVFLQISRGSSYDYLVSKEGINYFIPRVFLIGENSAGFLTYVPINGNSRLVTIDWQSFNSISFGSKQEESIQLTGSVVNSPN